MRPIIVFIAVLFLGIGSCNNNPVDSGKHAKPENHTPIIFSVTVFPDTLGPKDSAIVVCNAMDPDADTLVYDWISDGRLRIKGASKGEDFLYNTYENYRTVYPTQYVNVPRDTAWVQCFARDRKGSSAAKVVEFIIQQ